MTQLLITGATTADGVRGDLFIADGVFADPADAGTRKPAER